MSWEPEKVELLVKLFREGYSASHIAGRLGGGITRNAVIGKINRLGLIERRPAASAARPRKVIPSAARISRPARVAPVKIERPASGAPALKSSARQAPMREQEARSQTPGAPPPIEDDVIAAVSKRVSLLDLSPSHCRWPLGDPGREDFGFCGRRAADLTNGRPYCRHHAAIAYQPAQDRRAREDRRARARA